VTLRELGAYKLRGVTQPETIYQLVAADCPPNFRPCAWRNRARRMRPRCSIIWCAGSLVGRRGEFEQLAAALGAGAASARASGALVG